jgi:hypothetical protein
MLDLVTEMRDFEHYLRQLDKDTLSDEEVRALSELYRQLKELLKDE